MEVITLLVVAEDMGIGELTQGEAWKERKKSRKKQILSRAIDLPESRSPQDHCEENESQEIETSKGLSVLNKLGLESWGKMEE